MAYKKSTKCNNKPAKGSRVTVGSKFTDKATDVTIYLQKTLVYRELELMKEELRLLQEDNK